MQQRAIASHDKISSSIKALPRPVILFKNSTVVETTSSLSEGAATATMEEEAEELCFAGKHFFFVEPLEESIPLRSSWTAKGA
jgi:hypothetical protein